MGFYQKIVFAKSKKIWDNHRLPEIKYGTGFAEQLFSK